MRGGVDSDFGGLLLQCLVVLIIICVNINLCEMICEKIHGC